MALSSPASVHGGLTIRRPAEAGLTSAGLLIVNPPWTLAGELKAILPELEKPLGQGGAGRFRLETPKPWTGPARQRPRKVR